MTFLAAALLAASAAAAPQGYVLGVFPFISSSRLEQAFAPFAARLGTEIGTPVAYRSAADFDRFERALQEARFDFAFIQPFDYVRFAAAAGYRPLARLSQPLQLVLALAADSDVASLSALRGRRLGLPPPQAAVSILATSALLAAGLVPARDLENVNYRTHDDCLQGLTAGDVDACATAEQPLRVYETEIGRSLGRLKLDESLPGPLFVVHERVAAADAEAVRARLLDSAFVTELLPIAAPGLQVALDAEYEPVRAAWRRIQEKTTGPLSKLVFGVHPVMPMPQIEAILGPLAEALEHEAGIPVQMRTASSLERFVAQLEIGQYDIAVLQPFDFLRVEETMGYVQIVSRATNSNVAFFVAPDGPLATLSDLRGKTVAVPPWHTTSARLATCALRAAQLETGSDVQLLAVSGHEACFEAVAENRADACASGIPIARLLGQRDSFRAIASTMEASGPVIAAHPRVPETLRRALRRALLRWDAAQDPAGLAYLGPFAEASSDDFASASLIAAGGCPAETKPAAALGP